MEEQLKELLTTNGLTQVQIDYLVNNRQLTTVKKLSNLFDKREQVTDWVKGLDGPHNNNDDMLVGLKQAWREADNLQTLLLENKNIGSADDDYAPLPPATHKMLNTTFETKFGFQFQPSEIGADALVGRQRREMERKQPTIYDNNKVRRLVEVQFCPQAKKQKLAQDVSINIGSKPDDLPGLVTGGDLFNVLESNSVLMNTMAHAGTLHFTTPSGDTILYCDYQEVRKYVARGRLAVARALATGMDPRQVTLLFLSTDLKFREKWVELIRASPNKECYTTAIQTTLTTLEPIWNWENPSLQRASFTQPGNGAASTEGQAGASPFGTPVRVKTEPGTSPQSQNASPGNRPMMTAKFTNDGQQKICKQWCDHRNGKGCPDPCPRKEKHNYCDVLISQNQACGENHIRANHTGPIYGYVQ